MLYLFFLSAAARGKQKKGGSVMDQDHSGALRSAGQEAEKMTQEDEVSSKVRKCDPIYVRSAVAFEPS